MIDSLTVTPDNFGLVATFIRADVVVKGVMISLIGASVWSWTVIIDRALRLGAMKREANRFEAELAQGRSLEDMAKRAGDAPRHPLPQMVQLAVREGRARGADSGLVLTALDRSMESLISAAVGPERNPRRERAVDRRHDLALCRAVRDGVGHHERIPKYRGHEKYEPDGRCAGDFGGPVCNSVRSCRRYPRLHRLQHLLD